MNLNIFDTYNIRARLSVYIIVISPLLFTIYSLYESVRNISFSAIIIAFLLSISNYFFALQRFMQKNKKQKNVAAELLFLSDKRIDEHTKRRYYQRLSLIDKSFLVPSDNEAFKNACFSITHWLRNNTRDNKLVQEENILYGFYKNLLSFRIVGIISVVSAFLFLLFSTSSIFSNFPLLFFDSTLLFFWLFGVNDKIFSILSEKYAYALLGAIDSIEILNN